MSSLTSVPYWLRQLFVCLFASHSINTHVFPASFYCNQLDFLATRAANSPSNQICCVHILSEKSSVYSVREVSLFPSHPPFDLIGLSSRSHYYQYFFTVAHLLLIHCCHIYVHMYLYIIIFIKTGLGRSVDDAKPSVPYWSDAGVALAWVRNDGTSTSPWWPNLLGAWHRYTLLKAAVLRTQPVMPLAETSLAPVTGLAVAGGTRLLDDTLSPAFFLPLILCLLIVCDINDIQSFSFVQEC